MDKKIHVNEFIVGIKKKKKLGRSYGNKKITCTIKK